MTSKGGPLAVTDANLLLGRLITDYFPKIFGKSEKEPLNIEVLRTTSKNWPTRSTLSRRINFRSTRSYTGALLLPGLLVYMLI